ncbi:MAG: acyltransferase family protein [Rhizobacter sp.]
MTQDGTQISYRADVDGLRAVAVLAVVFFHAFPRVLTGGFAGVDAFFVVSGFLITGILISGMDAGKFSLAVFYERRIKRILPAFIAVCVVTTAFSLYFLTPNSFVYFSTSLASTWVFASNVFFSLLTGGYFDERTDEFPLLHTWSLGVEEQFYFVFPLFLVLLRRLGLPLLPVLVVSLLALLGLSQWEAGTAQAYYLPQYRAHQLLAGAIAYLLTKRWPVSQVPAATGLSALGAVLLCGSFVGLNKYTPYPGLYSMLPTLGSALMLYSGTRANPVSRVLQLRPVVFVGLISYSLYLWHWPALVFLRVRGIEMNAPIFVVYFGIILLLSWASWKYVEMPARALKQLRFKASAWRFYAAPAVVFIGLGVVSYFTEGIPQRFSGPLRELMASYSHERDLSRQCSVRADDFSALNASNLAMHCGFGAAATQKPSILLYGDSHADHFKPFVEVLARDAGVRAVYSIMGGCSAIAGLAHPGVTQRAIDACQRRNDGIQAMASQYRYVLLGGRWQTGGDPAAWGQEMSRVVQKVVDAGAIPVVFKDNPISKLDVSQCVLRKARRWLPADHDCELPRADVERVNGPADHAIDEIAKRFPTMRVIDLKQVMCDSTHCFTSSGNTAYYRDPDHINVKAAQLLGDIWLKEKGNPLR